MDKRITDMNSLGTPDDLDLIEVVDVSEPLPSNQNKKFSLANLKSYITNAINVAAHKVTHVTGGTDAFVVTDLLDAVARTIFRKNNAVVGTRRGLNFIEGTNTTIQVTDDSINEKVDVTINATVPAIITYTPNKSLFGDSTTGVISSYDSVERIVGQGVKITGESVFDTNVTESDPDFTFEVWKKTFNATTSTASTSPQFQLLADGTAVFHQFVRQNSPDGIIPAGHSIQFVNNENNGVFITNQLGKNNGLILHERASNAAFGYAYYTFNGGLQGTLATYLGNTYIPLLKIGYDDSQGDKKWLDIYTPNYSGGIYTNDKVHLSTRRLINGSTIGVTDRPKLKISADEFIIGVLSNDVAGGNSEGADTYRFTDKGLVFSGIVATTALNNSLFLDSGTGKLSFKDSLGNVNALY